MHGPQRLKLSGAVLGHLARCRRSDKARVAAVFQHPRRLGHSLARFPALECRHGLCQALGRWGGLSDHHSNPKEDLYVQGMGSVPSQNGFCECRDVVNKVLHADAVEDFAMQVSAHDEMEAKPLEVCKAMRIRPPEKAREKVEDKDGGSYQGEWLGSWRHGKGTQAPRLRASDVA